MYVHRFVAYCSLPYYIAILYCTMLLYYTSVVQGRCLAFCQEDISGQDHLNVTDLPCDLPEKLLQSVTTPECTPAHVLCCKD